MKHSERRPVEEDRKEESTNSLAGELNPTFLHVWSWLCGAHVLYVPCSAPLSRKLFRLKSVFLEARYWMKRCETEKRQRLQSVCWLTFWCTWQGSALIWNVTSLRALLIGGNSLFCLKWGQTKAFVYKDQTFWSSSGWQAQAQPLLPPPFEPGGVGAGKSSLEFPKKRIMQCSAVICSDLMEQHVILSQLYQRAGIQGIHAKTSDTKHTTDFCHIMKQLAFFSFLHNRKLTVRKVFCKSGTSNCISSKPTWRCNYRLKLEQKIKGARYDRSAIWWMKNTFKGAFLEPLRLS